MSFHADLISLILCSIIVTETAPTNTVISCEGGSYNAKYAKVICPNEMIINVDSAVYGR